MQRATAVPPKRAAYYDKVVGVVSGCGYYTVCIE